VIDMQLQYASCLNVLPLRYLLFTSALQ
jgi:hypothetical protein